MGPQRGFDLPRMAAAPDGERLQSGTVSPVSRPHGLSVAEECRLMRARSTHYAEPVSQPITEARIVARVKEICAEWPSYGYRRVTAELHATDCLVNNRKVMRLMRQHDLTVRSRGRFVAPTDNDHDGPIFPNLAIVVASTGPNQLWVADIIRGLDR
jgi:hypothetical protein